MRIINFGGPQSPWAIQLQWGGSSYRTFEGSRIYGRSSHCPIMAEDPQRVYPHQGDMAASGATFPTDSENYESSSHELSPSPPSSSRSPMILYSPPTIWGLLRGAAINLLLPFVNGLMLGFGELLAHEAAFRLGWSGTKVRWHRSYNFSKFSRPGRHAKSLLAVSQDLFPCLLQSTSR